MTRSCPQHEPELLVLAKRVVEAVTRGSVHVWCPACGQGYWCEGVRTIGCRDGCSFASLEEAAKRSAR
jgi:uncharacterized protein (DUF983 family)